MEVLAAMALFATAMLGVVFFTGKAIKNSANDNVRAIAIDVASNEIDLLNLAATKGQANGLRNALINFDSDGNMQGVSRSIKGNTDKDEFIVTIIAAVDNNNLDILNSAAPDTWKSPINLAVVVTYAEVDSIVARANYTIVF